MVTFIVIATLMVVTAVLVTICVMQQKVMVLTQQNYNLIAQFHEEKAKATKVLSEKEQELQEAKDRARSHYNDYNKLWLERRAAEEKKAAAAAKRAAAKATVKKSKAIKK